jgi:tRNA(adenine34) deaminase
MAELIVLAGKAACAGEVPVAAAVIDAAGGILAMRHNEVEARGDATAHAEMLVLQQASAARGEKYLTGCTLIVTLEPCAMCAQALSHAKISRLVFGAYDPKSGGVEHGARVFSQPTCHHRPEVIGGVAEAACAKLLSDFFLPLRG